MIQFYVCGKVFENSPWACPPSVFRRGSYGPAITIKGETGALTERGCVNIHILLFSLTNFI